MMQEDYSGWFNVDEFNRAVDEAKRRLGQRMIEGGLTKITQELEGNFYKLDSPLYTLSSGSTTNNTLMLNRAPNRDPYGLDSFLVGTRSSFGVTVVCAWYKFENRWGLRIDAPQDSDRCEIQILFWEQGEIDWPVQHPLYPGDELKFYEKTHGQSQVRRISRTVRLFDQDYTEHMFKPEIVWWANEALNLEERIRTLRPHKFEVGKDGANITVLFQITPQVHPDSHLWTSKPIHFDDFTHYVHHLYHLLGRLTYDHPEFNFT